MKPEVFKVMSVNQLTIIGCIVALTLFLLNNWTRL